MAAYASLNDIEARTTRVYSSADEAVLSTMLDDAGVLIDAYNSSASADVKKIVSCRMVIRAFGDSDDISYPMGATQGSMTAGGYTQSWTVGSGGGAGELYLSKMEKKLLGCGNAIGSYSPVEELTWGDWFA